MGEAQLNIPMTQIELEIAERQMRFARHIERYRFARRHCHGRVIDIGCGVGYGSYLISQNPDVKTVVGVDESTDAYKHATLNFKFPKITYYCQPFEVRPEFEGDVATIIEVLEHVEDPDQIIKDCYELGIEKIIATVPSFKTTHFNPYHVRDFSILDFAALMGRNNYPQESIREFGEEVFLGVFNRKEYVAPQSFSRNR